MIRIQKKVRRPALGYLAPAAYIQAIPNLRADLQTDIQVTSAAVNNEESFIQKNKTTLMVVGGILLVGLLAWSSGLLSKATR